MHHHQNFDISHISQLSQNQRNGGSLDIANFPKNKFNIRILIQPA